MRNISNTLLDMFLKWGNRVVDAFIKLFPQSLLGLGISILLIYAFSISLYQSFSFFTFITYIFFCIRNLDKIILDIRRSVAYGVSFLLCAAIVQATKDSLPLILDLKNIFSLVAAIYLLYVFGTIYYNSKEIRKR